MKKSECLRVIVILGLLAGLTACSPVKAVVKAPVKVANAVVETVL